RFVQETESLSVEEARIAALDATQKTVRRLTFLQDTVHRPLLSQTAREHGINFSILSGRFGQIKSTSCGQVTVSIEGDAGRVRAALASLAAEGVRVEEQAA
ncbi:MAG: methionine transporter ATP-binding protein, partial [Rhodoferax sp.]|nr:methionine transporter ATP-binding protein [Rhodoferax sp.]